MNHRAPDTIRRWQIGYATLVGLALAAPCILFCCADPPAFYEVEIHPSVRSTAKDAEACLTLRGIVTIGKQPLPVGEVVVSAYGEHGTPLHQTSQQLRPIEEVGTEGAFEEACIPLKVDIGGSDAERLARIHVTVAAPFAELAALDHLRWVADSAREVCDQYDLEGDARCHTLTGETTLSVSQTLILTHVQMSVAAWAMALGVGLFLCGLAAAILGTRRLGPLAGVGVSAATMLFAALMLVVVGSGYSEVLSRRLDGGTVIQTSMGYLTRGSYHDTIPDDWLFSLTLPLPSPFAAEAGNSPLRGFGAPLWVILLGVAGASIFAAQHLVRSQLELGATTAPLADDGQTTADPAKPPEASTGGTSRPQDAYADANALTSGKADQLLALAFSPIGAIYVYQCLILLEITGFVAVAASILASGMSVNFLVRFAAQRVKQIVEQGTGRSADTALPAAQGGSDAAAKQMPPAAQTGSDAAAQQTPPAAQAGSDAAAQQPPPTAQAGSAAADPQPTPEGGPAAR